MKLLDKGVSSMKFFPAEAAGGIPMLKAIAGQMAKLEHAMLAGFTHEPVVRLSERLAALAATPLASGEAARFVPGTPVEGDL